MTVRFDFRGSQGHPHFEPYTSLRNRHGHMLLLNTDIYWSPAILSDPNLKGQHRSHLDFER